jgi:uncharacterized protein DUF4062
VPPRLTTFVSSTVRDFGPVRRDLHRWLRAHQIDVRESEDPEFPVDPAVHSHDACLRAVDGCQLFVLLVGWRYGGLYHGSTQSITWREYDEAVAQRIPVVAVVLKEVADEATRIAQSRRALGLHGSRLDAGVIRFLDALRKGHTDNWIHLDWDGSFTHLKRCVQARMNALFVAYQRPHVSLQRDAQRLEPYVAARSYLDAMVARSRWALGAAPDAQARRAFAGRLLGRLAVSRAPLFDFADEIYDFVLHRREGDLLTVFARNHHPAIVPHNRSWRVGQGYVGELAAGDEPIRVVPDAPEWPSWHSDYETDALHYRSVMCVQLVSPGGARGVLTITSSRAGHFRRDQQLEALTARSVGAMISLTGVLDG